MAKLTISKKDMGEKPIVELVDLVKQFDEKTVLKDLNLAINKGEFVTILGASGSGKTTALKPIGGFEWPTRGEIKFNGIDVKDLPAYKRPTNTIFQDYALFPHLTVEGNIKYGLKLLRVKKENLNQSTLDRLTHKQEQWKAVAKKNMQKLAKEQKEYEAILEAPDANPKSSKYKKAQKFMDESDFTYSYWETYVNQKTEAFEKLFITRKLNKDEINKKVEWAIHLIGLDGNEKKAIDELSGGMKQRVALARALVTEPKILLLDEPLSALDLKVRQKMQRELRNIQKKLGLTFIFVTHDQEEAMTISDRIVVMRDGKVEQFDVPQKIYEYPVNSWVAQFIGESNIFPGVVSSQNKIKALNQILPGDTYDFKKGQNIKVMLRPEDITITKGKGFVKGEIISAIFQGTFWEYTIETKVRKWRVRTTKSFKVGQTANLKWTATDVHSMSK